jgi:hypothetical protein
LKNFLTRLFANISPQSVPDKDLYALDPESVKAAGLAQKDIKTRLAAVDQALKEIPANPTSGIPKTMSNYYNSLLVEKNLLNTLGSTLSQVSPKNPTIPASTMHSILNQSALYGNGQTDKDASNPYGFGSKEITQALLQKMGQGINPEMKNFQDWQAYSSYIDQYMKPFITRAMSSANPQGGSLSDVNKRLAYNSESQSGHSQEVEKAAGQGLANFVNLTQTLDPALRKQLWNMLPIWAAQQGLDWNKVKNYGLEHAENLINPPADANKTPKATQKVAKPKPTFAPEAKEKDAADTAWTPTPGSRAEGVANLGHNFMKNLKDLGQAVIAPAEAVTDYNYWNDPNKPGFLDTLTKEYPTSFLQGGAHLSRNQELEVPPDSLFVLGDNRTLSHDSHAWGLLPRSRVIGKAMFIFWPPDRIGFIH